LILGERDLENGEVTLKHMGSGDEEKVADEDVVNRLENELTG
jgi:histidyl-tRNA synthetase